MMSKEDGPWGKGSMTRDWLKVIGYPQRLAAELSLPVILGLPWQLIGTFTVQVGD